MNELQIIGIELLKVVAIAGGVFLLMYFKRILPAIVNGLVQQAEEKIQGSKLGAEKKAWVIAQLKAIGINGTAYISKLIDELVAIMNKQ